ncbi:3-oxoacyl-[acyl-carrier-protein] synthase-3 [Haloactinospora alba]|uniref:3-oxoacyl-[acyl-carrier-protein] synthase-3 n=1 Tax=Haloactinospora alba TaxID=405555 RepID=A0A543NNR0_9ACTN|nr:3-oxoacyl-[acyl-carrier-protein] synthase III C-terminal domain-containing protein [Haloactinospora alba]TQN33462.1 3-oxoacyl-[acyl-carrier-protein] synthase-3 [Haloactinospora alba]
MSITAGVLGTGYSLPPQVRRNDDPVYQALNTQRNAQGVIESAVFRGLDRRRFLAPGERIETHVVTAAQRALDQANTATTDVDRLYGYVTVPEYATPNTLYHVHHLLSLPSDAMVVPVNSEYSNFLLGLAHAAEAVESGRADNSLVACGTDWSRHMDYTKGHAVSIGDGAGAALVGPADRFVMIDHATRTLSSQYHGLNLRHRPLQLNGLSFLPLDPETNLPSMTYEMTQTGVEDLAGVIKDGVPTLVNELLTRNNIPAGSITLMTHQGSRILMDHWEERIAPGCYLDTLAEYGNMTAATYPVNLAHHFRSITTDHVVIVAVGCGLHLTAVVLRT